MRGRGKKASSHFHPYLPDWLNPWLFDPSLLLIWLINYLFIDLIVPPVTLNSPQTELAWMTLNFLNHRFLCPVGVVLLVCVHVHACMHTHTKRYWTGPSSVIWFLPSWYCVSAGDKDTTLITETQLLTVNVSVLSIAGLAQPQTVTCCRGAACLWLPITLQTEVRELKCQPQDPNHPRG